MSDITVEEVQETIQYLKSTDDPEDQHGAEDYTYVEVLRVAAKSPDTKVATLAQEALKITDLEFPRWYA